MESAISQTSFGITTKQRTAALTWRVPPRNLANDKVKRHTPRPITGYMRYRVEVISSSVQTEIRLFDVEADGRFRATLIAASMLCKEPFSEDDFKHKSQSRFWEVPRLC